MRYECTDQAFGTQVVTTNFIGHYSRAYRGAGMMHVSDADAPHARSTDAPPTHKACTAAQISLPTRQMRLERASGSKGSQNGGSETARAMADTATPQTAGTS